LSRSGRPGERPSLWSLIAFPRTSRRKDLQRGCYIDDAGHLAELPSTEVLRLVYVPGYHALSSYPIIHAIIENVILAGTLKVVIDGSILTNPPDRPISSLTSRRREHTWHGIFGPVLKGVCVEQQPNDGTSI
jgi:hypothetical protein